MQTWSTRSTPACKAQCTAVCLVWHDSCICVTCVIHIFDIQTFKHSYKACSRAVGLVWHDSFCVWHDLFICVTWPWLIHDQYVVEQCLYPSCPATNFKPHTHTQTHTHKGRQREKEGAGKSETVLCVKPRMYNRFSRTGGDPMHRRTVIAKCNMTHSSVTFSCVTCLEHILRCTSLVSAHLYILHNRSKEPHV